MRLWSPSLALNQSYFQWKFVENPHSQFGDIFLATAEDRLVGMRGFMGTLWTDPGGSPLAIPMAGDTVVAEDHEGHGIVMRLSDEGRREFASRGMPLVLNTSASPMVFWHSCRAGWK